MRATTALVGLTVIACGLCACERAPSGGAWPTQPVRLIVSFGAGSGVDMAARVYAARLAERWQRPVIVDNRPGPDGIVGTQAFTTAKDVAPTAFASGRDQQSAPAAGYDDQVPKAVDPDTLLAPSTNRRCVRTVSDTAETPVQQGDLRADIGDALRTSGGGQSVVEELAECGCSQVHRRWFVFAAYWSVANNPRTIRE